MNNYNPFVSASVAAYECLTSDQAKAYYQTKAQADIQTTVDTALTVGIGLYQLCSFIYALGATVGEAHYTAVSGFYAAPVPHVKALLAAPTPKALPPARLALPAAPRRTNQTKPLAVSGPIICSYVPDWVKEVGRRSVSQLLKDSKPELVAQCATIGLDPTGTKRQLAKRLAAL